GCGVERPVLYKAVGAVRARPRAVSCPSPPAALLLSPRQFSIRGGSPMSTVLLTLALVAPAQPANPPRFAWKADQIHTYKVVQQTVVRETTLDAKTEKPTTSEARTNLTLVKKWRVKSVDASGVATLEMTITEMKNEFRTPDGMPTVLDSTKPEDAMKMVGYLNVPVVVVRV